jgi:hypothetical protein
VSDAPVDHLVPIAHNQSLTARWRVEQKDPPV